MTNLKVGFIHITKSGGTNIKDKNKNNSGNVIESQKLSKIEEHVNYMIKILDKVEK